MEQQSLPRIYNPDQTAAVEQRLQRGNVRYFTLRGESNASSCDQAVAAGESLLLPPASDAACASVSISAIGEPETVTLPPPG